MERRTKKGFVEQKILELKRCWWGKTLQTLGSERVKARARGGVGTAGGSFSLVRTAGSTRPDH